MNNESRLADTLKGKVVKIADGDTFHLLLEDNSTQKIRLYGIDCPEKRQPYHQVAKDHLSELIFSKYILVVTKGKDQFGRVIGIAHAGNKIINEEMLRAGLAWHFTRYDQNPEWSKLEKEAAKKRIGLWKDKFPTPPWKWRNGRNN